MSATLTAEDGRCKHTFGTRLDFERPFGHDPDMHRTYVRRRITALVVALAAVVLISGPVARAVGTGAQEAVLVSSATYVVRPGDSLWTIASTVAPERDPRGVIADIQRLNSTLSTDLRPGQVLSIPDAG